MTITHKLTLDVARDGIQGNVMLVKGERGSRDIAFTLRNGKNAVELGDGYSAALRGIKPDGTELFNSCAVYTERGVYPNTVRYHITEQTVAVEGNFTVRLLIWDNEGSVLWSPEFSITVKENGSLDSEVGSQSEFTALIDAAVQAQNAAKAAEGNAEKTDSTADELKKDVQAWLKERDDGLSNHIADETNPHKVTAGQLGLERVDNTSDEEKPLSAAVRAALDALWLELNEKEKAIAESIAQSLIDSKAYADETKVGKRGAQVIDGSLSLGGDLLIGGKAYAKQIESLEVGDAVIIANADGVLLSELSGYVIRVNGASAYAIVYDPIDDCVKIGLGTYDSESKVFIFGEGEAQVLATRGVIADGNIPVWNDEKKTFEDSKISGDAVAVRGAIANGHIPEWSASEGKLVDSGKSASDFASKDSAQLVANALRESVSGEIVVLKDVSPVVHDLKVKVSSKNLLTLGLTEDITETKDKLICSFKTNNTLLLNGTSTVNTSFTFYFSKPISVIKGQTYTFSMDVDASQRDFYMLIRQTSDIFYSTYHSINFTAETDSIISLGIIVLANKTFTNKEIKVQLELDTTATTHTPYVAYIEAVKLKVQGKNLVCTKDFTDAGFTDLGNGEVYITESQNASNKVLFANTTKTPGRYMISGYMKHVLTGEQLRGIYLNICYTDGTIQQISINNITEYTYFTRETLPDKTVDYISFGAGSSKAGTYFKDFQIEYGKTVTAYEEGLEPITYEVGENGSVTGVKSIYPATTLTTDTEGVLIEVEYNRDINQAFAELKAAILSLGGNV